jgi:hypothetical protein
MIGRSKIKNLTGSFAQLPFLLHIATTFSVPATRITMPSFDQQSAIKGREPGVGLLAAGRRL